MQGGEGGWRVYPQAIFLAGRPVHVRKPVLVHDPIRFVALGSFPSVEHQSLLDTYWLWMADRLVGPGRLPVPGSGGPVRPRAIWVLSVPWREEIPLLFTVQSLACNQSDQYNNTSESEWGIEHTKGREWSREPNHPAMDREGCWTVLVWDLRGVRSMQYQEAPKDRACRGRSRLWSGRRSVARRTWGRGSASQAPRP